MTNNLPPPAHLRLVPTPAQGDKAPPALGRFRPASEEDFFSYAKNLAWLRRLPLQASQELLARIYGYPGTHELRAVLRGPGEPGPFSPPLYSFTRGYPKRTLCCPPPNPAKEQRGVFNRLLPPVIEGETPLESGRTARLFNAIFANDLDMEDGSDAFRRRMAIFEAGFFCAPKHHRAMFSIVKEGCLAAEQSVQRYTEFLKDHWPVGYWGLIEYEYRYCSHPTAHSDPQHDPWEAAASTPWEPRLMRRALEAYQAACLYAAIVAPCVTETAGPPMDWAALFEWDTLDWSSVVEDSFDWRESPWLQYLAQVVYPDCTAKAFDADSLTEEQGDAIEDFLNQLDTSLITGNPLLEAIPNVLELAKSWRFEQLRQLCDRCIEQTPRQIVLEAVTPWSGPPRLNGQSFARLEVTAHFELAKNPELAKNQWGALSLWRYHATFSARQEATGPATLAPQTVGTISGWLIAPFDANYHTSADRFFEDLDAESAELNDVWKVLQSVYFPSQGLSDVEDFCQQYPFEAMATANVCLLPKFRRQGLVPACLNLLREALEDCPGSRVDYGALQEAQMLSPGDFGRDAEYAEMLEEQDPYPYVLGAPKVFVMGIAGARSEQRYVSFAARSSFKKLAKKDPDAPAEKLKKKLMKHFLGMRQHLQCDLVVYDPNEYPVT